MPGADFRETLYLDCERDFVVLRRTTAFRDELRWQGDVSYKVDAEIGWIPNAWEYVFRAGEDRHVQESGRCRLINYELNVEMADDEFDIEFPPSTRVFDDTKEKLIQYVVMEDGKPGRQIYDANGPTYEDLLQPAAGRRWLVLAIGFIVSGFARFAWLWRRRRRDDLMI